MTLRDLMQFVCACAEQSGHSFSEDFVEELTRQIVQEYRGEKVYVPHPDQSKKAEIAAAAKNLPTNVVAQRFGVSRRWANKVVSRREK